MKVERRWLNEVFLIVVVFVALAWTLDVMAEGAEPAPKARVPASAEAHAAKNIQRTPWVHVRQKELWYGQKLMLSQPGVLTPSQGTKRMSVLGREITPEPAYQTPLWSRPMITR